MNEYRSALPAPTVSLLDSLAGLAETRDEAVYLVGGAVRDLLLGRPLGLDIDVTVEGDAQALADALARSIGGQVVARSQFGTASLRVGAVVLDLAMSRREHYPNPGDLPVVEPAPLPEDLARRDFAVHAMAIPLAQGEWGDLIDPHDGRGDLSQKLIRVLHPASFRDDPTRMARALRYAHRLQFSLAPATLALLQRDTPALAAVSGPRRWRELHRALDEPDPEGTLRAFESNALLAQLHPALTADQWFSERSAWLRHSTRNVPYQVLLCLLVFRASADAREQFIAEFQLSEAEASALRDLAVVQAAAPSLADSAVPPSTMAPRLDALSPYALLAATVGLDEPLARASLRSYLAVLRYVKPWLNGDALLRLGAPAGPQIGEYLGRLRAARLDDQISTEEQEVALVQGWLQEGRPAG